MKAWMGLLLVAGACTPKPAANPSGEPVATVSRPSELGPAPITSTAATAPAPSSESPWVDAKPASVDVIALGPDSIAVDGEPLVDKDGKPYSGVRRRIALHGRLWLPTDPKLRTRAVDRPDLDKVVQLTATDAVDGALFKEVYLAAHGYRKVVMPLVPEGVTFDLDPAEAKEKRPLLVYLVRRDVFEVWRMEDEAAPASSSGEKPDPPLPSVTEALRFKAKSSPPKDAPALAKFCSKFGNCNGYLYLDDDATVASLRSALALLNAARRGQTVVLQFRLYELPASTTALRETYKSRSGGRLAPEVIQKVVREQFGTFRACYEQGLGRNPDLVGEIRARFVIGVEGDVIRVTDGGSSVPDAEVLACVLEAFQQLKFPKPEGGIVTVVYPIMFAPG